MADRDSSSGRSVSETARLELRDIVWGWDPLGIMGVAVDEHDGVVDAVHREETLRRAAAVRDHARYARVSECERVVTLVYPKTTGAALVPRLTEGRRESGRGRGMHRLGDPPIVS